MSEQTFAVVPATPSAVVPPTSSAIVPVRFRPAGFRVGDVVEVVHHFHHVYRPSDEADGQMTGNLEAVICKVSAVHEVGGVAMRSYAIVWLGGGIHARVLSRGGRPILEPHHRGMYESWWDESTLRMVRPRPRLPEELQLVLKTGLGD